MPLPDFDNDDRLDPRVRRVLPLLSNPEPRRPVASREALLAAAATPAAAAARELTRAATERMDREEIASFDGISTDVLTFRSTPDDNPVKINMIRPESGDTLPCVVYLHGGGMARNSAFDGNYRVWGRLLAAEGAVVAMIDFRNSLEPSTAEEVAVYPAGLDDCVAGVRWVSENAAELGIDPARIVVAGDSGGGNLTLATGMRLTADGDTDLVKGLYAFCPYIALDRNAETYPSSAEFEGYFLRLADNEGRYAYGVDAADARDPMAWPAYATADDVAGLPPTVISVNECDPLRDEGIAFYRTLLAAGVSARCVVVMGTMHAVEVIPNVCPDISRAAARDVVGFATTTPPKKRRPT
jgi:acetyl esterase/lipase